MGVDQDVHRSEAFHDLVHQGLHTLFIGHIHIESGRFHFGLGLNSGGRLLQGFQVPAGHDDLGAHTAQFDGAFFAKATGTTNDHRNFTFQVESGIHDASPFFIGLCFKPWYTHPAFPSASHSRFFAPWPE